MVLVHCASLFNQTQVSQNSTFLAISWVMKDVMHSMRFAFIYFVFLGGWFSSCQKKKPVASHIYTFIPQALCCGTCPLVSLYLSCTAITDGLLAIISPGLSSSKIKLELLDISDNLISDSGAQTLAKILTDNTVLEALHFQRNAIGSSSHFSLFPPSTHYD